MPRRARRRGIGKNKQNGGQAAGVELVEAAGFASEEDEEDVDVEEADVEDEVFDDAGELLDDEPRLSLR